MTTFYLVVDFFLDSIMLHRLFHVDVKIGNIVWLLCKLSHLKSTGTQFGSMARATDTLKLVSPLYASDSTNAPSVDHAWGHVSDDNYASYEDCLNRLARKAKCYSDASG